MQVMNESVNQNLLARLNHTDSRKPTKNMNAFFRLSMLKNVAHILQEIKQIWRKVVFPYMLQFWVIFNGVSRFSATKELQNKDIIRPL